MYSIRRIILYLITLCTSSTAWAHEVYVLDPSEIDRALHTPPPDFLTTIQTHLSEFIRWGLISVFVIVTVFFISISRPVEKKLDPLLFRLKRWAPVVAQLTLGLALLASGWYKSAFGIELPFILTFGSYTSVMQIVFITAGAMLVVGVFPRLAAFVVTGLFCVFILTYGDYMLNYGTYFGESLAIALLGHAYALEDTRVLDRIGSKKILLRFHKYKFLLLRIFFGTSLIYASVYAKFIHGNLALETVTKYNLTSYFPFDPVFLVLGAMLIEILLGVCFIVGFEVRFASLFFLVFLILSILFFGEAVWPHIILIGTAIAMFTHGYDRYTLTGCLSDRNDLEPVL